MVGTAIPPVSIAPAVLQRVDRFARREGLFRRARNILVAVSGGTDSVACLLVLDALRERHGFDLQVVHFDHQLRPNSRDDLEFVRELAGTRELPFLSAEGDVGAVARQQRASIEDTARRMRYQFLAFVAAEKRADAIATGHTADDQAETVLMRILRGAGVRGIRGMLPASPVPGAPAQRLIRPLLELTRADTAAICEGAGIVPIEDASNADTAFARNRLRHEILPTLRAINPSVDRALRGLGQSAREVFGDVERASYTAQPLSRGPAGAEFALGGLRDLPAEALTLVIEREGSFYSLDVEANRTRLGNLRAVLRRGSGQVEFGAAQVQVSSGRVRIGPVLAVESFEPKVLSVPGVTLAGRWRAQVSTDPLPPLEGAVDARIDISQQKGALRLRQVATGDRMTYHGIERKVSDVFANAKVPAWDRASAVAIADSARVLAVVSAAGTFETDSTGDDVFYLRLTTPQPPSAPAARLELPS